MRSFLRSALSKSLPSDASAITPLTQLVDAQCSSVVTCPNGEITRAALEELFQHRCCAVRVPNFYPRESGKIMRERLLQSDQRTNWAVADPQKGLESSDVESVGTPLTVVLQETSELASYDTGVGGEEVESATSVSMQRYLQNAKELTRYLRTGVSQSTAERQVPPGIADFPDGTGLLMMTPMDKLRLELDANWLGGAGAARDEGSGEQLLAGAGRIMHPRGSDNPGFCHVDDIAVMKDFSGTFSANVYLQTPPPGCGGELHIWPLQVNSRWDFYKHAASLSLLLTQEQWAQDALRRVLPPPVSIMPEEGELILICAQRPHAVTGFDAGLRVSMQAFVNVTGKHQRLTLDS